MDVTAKSLSPDRKKRFTLIILAYPFAMLLIGLAANLLFFGISQVTITLPAPMVVNALIAAAILLVINHAWLMTSTELTRLNHNLHATPEEWAASGTTKDSATKEALAELERRHNAHRNTTENTIYFVLLAAIFCIVSPPAAAAITWLTGFAVARLGYTYSYLRGHDDARGIFMSASLIAMFGMASYLAIAAMI
ncbi:MAG: MAPEG family protein [Boseongicola sp.]|nr:MAG: MAPEG family protein [Boseongicola sp.]